tara:strand:+ start:2315 stop:4180 length:1866 start_codon:yes stop_codon:yes gene_type:complete
MNEIINYINNYVSNKKSSNDEIIESQRLVEIGFNVNNYLEKEKIFEMAFKLNPRNGNALIHYALLEMNNNNNLKQAIGIILLEKAFDSNFVYPYISIDTLQGEFTSKLIARYYTQNHYYKKAKNFFLLAQKSRYKQDNVSDIQLATLITGYPLSCIDAKNIVKEYNERIDNLLKLDCLNISSAMKDNDPYIFCILSAFNIEIYYEGDFREMMKKNYELTIKAFPHYKYISPYIENEKININEKYKIGIASGFYYKDNSVLADFQGVLDRLPRSKFDITYIYLKEAYLNDSEYLLSKNDNVIIITGEAHKDWLSEARTKIGKLKLDLILYLDSTMSSISHRVLMSKLAKVQAVSHGHPVTTGVYNRYMDYYVSWGAAELDYEESKNHYTEKLILLPKDKMHQYYSPRINEDGLSVINNLPYKQLTREDFKEYVIDDGNWYTCMQKPFKRHPEFYQMLALILEKDKNGRLLLHDSDNDEIKEIVNNRLKNVNIDINRVHFIPCQKHNKLMALYNLSDVVLDSYHAGGCTTTREVLELGIPVVTLPAKYLGGRWSLAYYNIINVDDMIARSKENYVDISVKIATDKNYRNTLKKKILDNIHKLFYQDEAVESWSNVIEEMIINR